MSVSEGTRVVLTTRLNSGRYMGRKGTVTVAGDENKKTAVRLDDFAPGLDAPDGVVYLYSNEFYPDSEASEAD